MTDAPDAGMGGFDISALLEQAQQMQAKLVAAQQEQAAKTVVGTAGGGQVSVKMTGAGEFLGVSVAPEAVDPGEVELLEELILAALRDATRQVTELQEAGMGDMGLGDGGIGGMDLGGLGGMLGGS